MKKEENKVRGKNAVSAIMEIASRQFVKPPKKSKREKKITLTEDELTSLVAAVRAEEQAWVHKRSTRHAMLARVMGENLKPELAKYLHGNQQVAAK